MGASVLLIFVPLYYLSEILGVDLSPFIVNNLEWFGKLIKPLLDFLVLIGIARYG